MVDSVSDQVQKGLADLVEDRLVQLGLLTFELQAHLLAVGKREVAHQALEALEHALHRQHAHLHDGLAQIVGALDDQLARLAEGAQKLPVRDLLAQALFHGGKGGALDDELAHEVQELVKLLEVDL